MSAVLDFRNGRPMSAYDIARRRLQLAEHQRLAPNTRCRAVGGDVTVTVIGAPDALGNHPVRLALADGQVRDFQLPAISLTPVHGEGQ